MKAFRRVMLMFLAVSLMSVAYVPTYAATVENTVVIEETENVAPCADVIEIKYRVTVDGVYQYRRWNATQGYWVDPEWIDM